MSDEIMNGSKPEADLAIARDLGVTLSPEQDEVTPPPPVVLGNRGYETDASGKPIEMNPFWARVWDNLTNVEKCVFRQGMIYARSRLIGKKISDWDEAHNIIENEEHRLRMTE